ncbi:MAG: hypothetical protein HF976_11665 [ANME-2 cluster archaeon]|nr:hypothetical protein [ANME-2 cluster archaeon]MBC2702041.1 hypothetical protein [ANME-2 cluster archaeon]MBC2707107.1 hypothetical protein [ANME-2 cluster archaeon]MBC2747689.1 hypothetical protein [ANME-2 cluster archaeon]
MKQEIKERMERIRKGEVPEGYRKTKVGIIPDDWAVKKLAEVSDIKTGPFGSALHQKDYVQEGTPIITVEHLGEQGVVHDNLPMVSDFDRNRLKSYVLKRGDIVFSRVGSVDRNSLIRETEDGWLFSGRLLRIRVTTANILPNYLSYHFHQEITKQRIRSVAVGQTMASLNTQILKDLHVSFPPIRGEQNAITTILSDADAIIRQLEKLIEEKKEFKRGLMQKLLTGDTRFPEFTDEWDEVKIGDLIVEFSDFTAKNNQHEILSVTKDGICLQSYHFKKQIASSDNIGYKIINKGELVFSTMNLWMGSLDILKYPNIGLVSPAYKTFKINYDKVDGAFFEELIKSSKMLWFYKINSEQGASIVRRNLDLQGLLSTKIQIPKINEQMKIGQFIQEINLELNNLRQYLENLKEQKRGLMQLLLTGIVRVEVD